ncbi:MAG: aminomethyltransferase [Halothiobacillaceae bacterium]|nr:MAG: aminomethyltransferase [Halothiobacillaceae bacterium]
MAKQTPLYALHLESGAKMVDFSGWDMPLHYGSQLAEHHRVRNGAGMFDVSHMTIVDMRGAGAADFLRHLFANNVDRLQQVGKALYTCMLNEQGGIIDDLIVYYTGEQSYRIVFNAGTRDKALAWSAAQSQKFDVVITPRDDLTMLAIQGPIARDKVHHALGTERAAQASQLTPFNGRLLGELFISRTGYTGEDGYELMLPHLQAVELWQKLLSLEVQPVGLGARDTLRLEAGMNLYGVDMDETTTPLESGLGWTVGWEPAIRRFIGRDALEAQRKDESRCRLVGLVFTGKGVLRNHQKISVDGRLCGEITSGSFSPTLGCSIALARVPRNVGDSCHVDIRGTLVTAKVVKPPFVRHGKSCLNLPV